MNYEDYKICDRSTMSAPEKSMNWRAKPNLSWRRNRHLRTDGWDGEHLIENLKVGSMRKLRGGARRWIMLNNWCSDLTGRPDHFRFLENALRDPRQKRRR
jgi:hypothetical protein